MRISQVHFSQGRGGSEFSSCFGSEVSPECPRKRGIDVRVSGVSKKCPESVPGVSKRCPLTLRGHLGHFLAMLIVTYGAKFSYTSNPPPLKIPFLGAGRCRKGGGAYKISAAWGPQYMHLCCPPLKNALWPEIGGGEVKNFFRVFSCLAAWRDWAQSARKQCCTRVLL